MKPLHFCQRTHAPAWAASLSEVRGKVIELHGFPTRATDFHPCQEKGPPETGPGGLGAQNVGAEDFSVPRISFLRPLD